MANFMDAIRKTLSENVTVTEVPDQTTESTVDVTELAVSDEPINELSKDKIGTYITKSKMAEIKGSPRRKGLKLAGDKVFGRAKVNAKEEVITKKETNMNEAAVDTLKPGAMAISDPMSKFEVIRAAIGAMHAMSTDELVKLYNASIAQIGHEADSVSNNAASNRASVAMKPSAAREDVEKMFDGQDLSEEFKSTATTLFEAAVMARAEEEIKSLRALYEETYTKQVEEIVEDLSGQVDEVVSNLTEQLDKYIDYAVESWMEDNQVAIESTLRSELTEEFIKDLRNLFVEHNISIPEESVEVVEELAARVEELESMLNNQIDENINIKNALIEAEIESMVEEAMHGMTLADQEKFRTMIEAVEFSGDLDDLSEKLQLIKKTYFTEQKKVHSSNIVDETFESETPKTVVTDPNIARYVSAIERTTRSKI